jgi:hypothetical protein
VSVLVLHAAITDRVAFGVGLNVTVVLRGHFVHQMTSRLEFRECLLFENRAIYVKFVSVSV